MIKDRVKYYDSIITKKARLELNFKNDMKQGGGNDEYQGIVSL
jgi:hypothetical protein